MSTTHELSTSQDVIDPVCGMTIAPADAVGHVEHRGHTYYFCNDSCLTQFRADPEQFLDPARRDQSAAAAAGGEWTCPMHPEIVRDTPGSCPICGMALEPRTATLDEGPNPELIDMTRRFWIAA